MLSAFKNFGITFLIAGIIFGLIGYTVTSLVNETMSGIIDGEKDKLGEIIGQATGTSSGTASSSTEPTTPPEDLPKGESFSLLLVVTDRDTELHDDYLPTKDELYAMTDDEKEGLLSKTYRTVNAASIVLIRGDRERAEYTYTPISSQTEIYASCGNITIGEAYGYYGEEFIVNSVWSLTGIKPEHYVFLNVTELDKIIEQLPNVSYELPIDIYFNGSDYGSLTFMAEGYEDGIPEPAPTYYKGNTALNAKLLYAIAAYRENDPASNSAKMTMAVDIAKLYLKAAASLDLENLTNRIQSMTEDELIKTDLEAEWLENNYEMLTASEKFTEKTLAYPGSFRSSSISEDGIRTDALFTPSYSAALEQFQQYRFTKNENQSK